MSNVVQYKDRVPAMSDEVIARVKAFEMQLAELPQVTMETEHVIHGGMYARTIMISAGVAITGALVKVPTMLIVNGHVLVTVGDYTLELVGHHVLPASGHRKQAFYAVKDTYLTMLFATDATSVEQAEDEFTDDAERLMSRHPSAVNQIVITGE